MFLAILILGMVVFLAEAAIVPPAEPPGWAPARTDSKELHREPTTDYPEPDDIRQPGVAAHGAGLGQSPRHT